MPSSGFVSPGEAWQVCMYTGTLIKDLLFAVEKAEKSAAARRFEWQQLAKESSDDCAGKDLQSEQLAQPLGLSPADRNLGLFLVVHPELVGTLKPRNDFADSIDVDYVRPVSAPEKIRI